MTVEMDLMKIDVSIRFNAKTASPSSSHVPSFVTVFTIALIPPMSVALNVVLASLFQTTL
jgi:hypothetical protein